MNPTLPRFFISLSAVILVMLAAVSALRAQQTLGIAAVVNEQVISFFDLQTRINLLIGTSNQRNTPENRQRYTGQVLNQLIDERLQMQEAERLDILISDKELERAYGNVARSSKMTSQQLTAFLDSKGIEKEVLIGQLHAQIAWGRTVNRLFRSEISIGNDEVDEIIAEIEKSKGQPEYLVGEIFIPIDRPENIEKNRAAANTIISQIKGGAKFSVLARNFSQSATAAVGGDLGWVRRGQLVAELDNAIAAMADGTLSEPIKTSSGFYILLKRRSRTGQGLGSSNEQVDLYQVYTALPPEPTTADIQAGMDAAAALTAVATNCDDMEAIGKRTNSPLSGRLGKVKTASLPPQTRQLIEKLGRYEPSRPTRSGSGIIVLMVCEREGKMSLSDVRDGIEKNLLNKRLDILARRHMRDLRRTAFLEIRI